MVLITHIKNTQRAVQFLAALFLVLLCSCSEPYTMEVDDYQPQLVITCCLKTIPGTYQVYVQSTAKYFDQGDTPYRNDAEVWLNELRLPLSDSLPGTYCTPDSFAAVAGQEYRLRVRIDFDGDGVVETYEASAVAPITVPLTKAFMQPMALGGSDAILPAVAMVLFRDPVGPNYYGAHFYLTTAIDSAHPYQRYHMSNQLSKYATNILGPEVSDGSIIAYPAYALSRHLLYTPMDTLVMYPFDTVSLELNNFTADYYNFITQARESATGQNPLFMTPAGRLTGNFSNGALGAFGICSASQQSFVIPWQDNLWDEDDLIRRFGVHWREYINRKLEEQP